MQTMQKLGCGARFGEQRGGGVCDVRVRDVEGCPFAAQKVDVLM
jgi:hypothetical protein